MRRNVVSRDGCAQTTYPTDTRALGIAVSDRGTRSQKRVPEWTEGSDIDCDEVRLNGDSVTFKSNLLRRW